MRNHPEVGYRIAQTSYELAHIADAILAHHERWDGQGYPQGLQGMEIPLAARIVAILDAWDVLQHDRPYRRAVSQQEALDEIKRCAGSQFDPRLVEIFLRLVTGAKTTGKEMTSNDIGKSSDAGEKST